MIAWLSECWWWWRKRINVKDSRLNTRETCVILAPDKNVVETTIVPGGRSLPEGCQCCHLWVEVSSTSNSLRSLTYRLTDRLHRSTCNLFTLRMLHFKSRHDSTRHYALNRAWVNYCASTMLYVVNAYFLYFLMRNGATCKNLFYKNSLPCCRYTTFQINR